MKIRVSDEAEDDIVLGAQFYESQSPGLGDRFRHSMVEEIERLATIAGVHVKLFGYRRYLCRRFPFMIFYAVEGNVLSIVAVIHARRHPESMRRRLSDLASFARRRGAEDEAGASG